MSKHHYFLAAKLPKEVKDYLKEWVEKNKADFPFAKWVHHEDYHITLAFLGFAEESMKQEVLNTMSQTLIEESPFILTLNKIGTFGPHKKPRIFWGDVEQSDSLNQVQKKVHRQCMEIGFQLDKKPFRPHITLARKWQGENDFDIVKLEEFEDRLSFTVDEVVLYETHLDKTPKYHEYARFSLA
ncbi:RNA 2',3'-cyclic phosphodiesterase [Lysinibacillus sp. SGAir0095]|uniref:RNA 2',3'-cyclic phosphodiesterase n=1 Tax=Lysinibacillus sp. SGAir0095 TaxID=2070463 RepID=UPI0010CD1949|nr:RNA 2',3'-cyclic phosphodiesterase [Lysinibacillus sp. SGAir0095]QCR30958.1 RNA 2',3'-cyclic phosphodiesterase [Lysinibacillus sp. SGAir0095]